MTDTPEQTVSPRLTHDAFVSYRRFDPDRSWVKRRFVPALRAGGVRVFLDETDFRLGEPLIDAMTRGVEVSRYTVAVLTPGYLLSSFTELESLMAEHLGLEKKQGRLIGVMREPVEARLSMRLRLWLDLTDDADFEEGVARIVREVLTPRPAENGLRP
jgi:hypothetical protein